MYNLPLNKNRREYEWQTILQIAKNNHFPIALIHNLKHRMTQERKQPPYPSPTQPTKNENWATFTFSSTQIRKVTNLLKKTGIKIAFSCYNTLAHLIKTTTNTRTPPHNSPDIYQLKCHTCNHSYVGQTSHNLKTRYNEHIRYIKSNNPQSAYAQHILNNRHDYGTIDNLMTLLKPIHNQHLLTTYEQCFIHSFHKHGNLISEQSPGSPNPLFDLAIHPPQPHTNKVSCATYFPMDTQAANRIWLPTQSRVYEWINLYIRSHLYTTAETTNHNNPPHHTTHLTWKQTNLSTRKYYTCMEITLPIVTALHHTWKKYH